MDPVSIAEVNANLDEGMYATLKRFTMLSILGIFCTMFSLVMASIFELIPVWLSIDMMVTQTLIMFMYKVHNGWYISCCGRLENFLRVISVVLRWIILSMKRCRCQKNRQSQK